jgi:hypothetical protein
VPGSSIARNRAISCVGAVKSSLASHGVAALARTPNFPEVTALGVRSVREAQLPVTRRWQGTG